MLSIIRSLQHFKNYIFNAKIIIKTDNRKYTFSGKVNHTRVNRWKLLLNEFDYEIQHIKGKENLCADWLSRINNINTNYETQTEIEQNKNNT